MTCIHCEKNPRLPGDSAADGIPGGSVYCRLCALAYRKQRDALVGLPWWQWPAYDPIPWTKYLTAVIAELGEPESPLALRCSRPELEVRLPPAAIRVAQELVPRSS